MSIVAQLLLIAAVYACLGFACTIAGRIGKALGSRYGRAAARRMLADSAQRMVTDPTVRASVEDALKGRNGRPWRGSLKRAVVVPDDLESNS